MSGIFQQTDIDTVIEKLQNGQTLDALNQVLSNDRIAQILTIQSQINLYNSQVAVLTQRIAELTAEYNSILGIG